jgi:hypothetical protein
MAAPPLTVPPATRAESSPKHRPVTASSRAGVVGASPNLRDGSRSATLPPGGRPKRATASMTGASSGAPAAPQTQTRRQDPRRFAGFATQAATAKDSAASSPRLLPVSTTTGMDASLASFELRPPELPPVHDRHQQIEQDDSGQLIRLRQQVQRLLAVLGRQDSMAGGGEQVAQAPAHVGSSSTSRSDGGYRRRGHVSRRPRARPDLHRGGPAGRRPSPSAPAAASAPVVGDTRRHVAFSHLGRCFSLGFP